MNSDTALLKRTNYPGLSTYLGRISVDAEDVVVLREVYRELRAAGIDAGNARWMVTTLVAVGQRSPERR